jgi:hypothetical protein
LAIANSSSDCIVDLNRSCRLSFALKGRNVAKKGSSSCVV